MSSSNRVLEAMGQREKKARQSKRGVVGDMHRGVRRRIKARKCLRECGSHLLVLIAGRWLESTSNRSRMLRAESCDVREVELSLRKRKEVVTRGESSGGRQEGCCRYDVIGSESGARTQGGRSSSRALEDGQDGSGVGGAAWSMAHQRQRVELWCGVGCDGGRGRASCRIRVRTASSKLEVTSKQGRAPAASGWSRWQRSVWVR